MTTISQNEMDAVRAFNAEPCLLFAVSLEPGDGAQRISRHMDAHNVWMRLGQEGVAPTYAASDLFRVFLDAGASAGSGGTLVNAPAVVAEAVSTLSVDEERLLLSSYGKGWIDALKHLHCVIGSAWRAGKAAVRDLAFLALVCAIGSVLGGIVAMVRGWKGGFFLAFKAGVDDFWCLLALVLLSAVVAYYQGWDEGFRPAYQPRTKPHKFMLDLDAAQRATSRLWVFITTIALLLAGLGVNHAVSIAFAAMWLGACLVVWVTRRLEHRIDYMAWYRVSEVLGDAMEIIATREFDLLVNGLGPLPDVKAHRGAMFVRSYGASTAEGSRFDVPLSEAMPLASQAFAKAVCALDPRRHRREHLAEGILFGLAVVSRETKQTYLVGFVSRNHEWAVLVKGGEVYSVPDGEECSLASEILEGIGKHGHVLRDPALPVGEVLCHLDDLALPVVAQGGRLLSHLFLGPGKGSWRARSPREIRALAAPFVGRVGGQQRVVIKGRVETRDFLLSAGVPA